MIIQLLPDQIPRYWEEIRQSLVEAAPPLIHHDPEKYSNILLSLLAGRMQCWISVDTEQEPHKVLGILTTTIVTDSCSGTKMLLLYSGYSTGNVSHDYWLEGMEAFRKFAKAQGCNMVGVYTSVPYMKQKIKDLGATVEAFGYWTLED